MSLSARFLASWILIGVVSGCTPREKDRPTGPQPAAAPTTLATPSPTPTPAVSADHQVLDAVLADLLASSKSPLAVRDAPPTEIRLAPNPPRYPIKVEGVLMRHDEQAWAALTPEQLAAAKEAADALIQRHQAGETFAPYRPADARVKIETEKPTAAPSTPLSRFDRPVQAYPPGFTADGKFAAVALSVPWSMHHADATYLLARDGDGWKVVLRQFIYYV
jgi:hypothetical protein